MGVLLGFTVGGTEVLVGPTGTAVAVGGVMAVGAMVGCAVAVAGDIVATAVDKTEAAAVLVVVVVLQVDFLAGTVGHNVLAVVAALAPRGRPAAAAERGCIAESQRV